MSRNGLSWERRFELDVWYVDNWSLSLDVRILLQTLWAVITGQGVNQEGAWSAWKSSGALRRTHRPHRPHRRERTRATRGHTLQCASQPNRPGSEAL